MAKSFRCIITSAPRFEYVVEEGQIRPRQDSDEGKQLVSPLGITVDLPYKTPDGEVESLIAYAMVPIDQKGEVELAGVATALAKISMIINSYLSNPAGDAHQQLKLALAGDDTIN